MKLFLFLAALLPFHVQGIICYAGTAYYGSSFTLTEVCSEGENCYYYQSGSYAHYGCAAQTEYATYQNNGFQELCKCSTNYCNHEYCGLFICFDGGQKVEVKGDDGIVEEKLMKDLEIGDNVHVGHGEYNKIFAFSHKTANETSAMLKIHTDHGHIKLSPSHYIYANNKHIPSKEVKVGDFLHKQDGSLTAVKKIESVMGSGLYAPHTVSGKIMVNGHKASCYTTAVNPTIAHAALKPIGMLYEAGITSPARGIDELMNTKHVASAAHKLFGE